MNWDRGGGEAEQNEDRSVAWVNGMGDGAMRGEWCLRG